jgi:hypothetical protein
MRCGLDHFARGYQSNLDYSLPEYSPIATVHRQLFEGAAMSPYHGGRLHQNMVDAFQADLLVVRALVTSIVLTKQ